jgi:phosphate transport system permease protein
VSGIADTVYVVWADGHLVRFDIRDIERPVLAETLDVVPEPDRRLTVAKFLIGKTSLAFGDSAGETRVWFRTKPEGATTADATTLVRSTVFAGAGSPVTALAPSSRTRMLAAGYESGAVRLFHVTSGQLLAETNFEPAAAATALSITAKDDGLFGATSVGLTRWSVHAPHPETTAAAIFGKVWYEGYETPAHVWQSAGGTDDFEPKFGLVPLIFGTIKATVYSMIFGVPLALLAAVFTSEFLGPRARSRIKPTIEMMASLPSVVLGFLAALIFAPFIAAYIPQALTALVTVPFTFLAGGYAWQLLPTGTAMRLSRFRFPIICATVPVGFSLAILAGPGVERLFFAGHIMEWLDGQRGTGVGAWMMLLLPVSALGVALLLTQVVNPRIAVVASGRAWSRARVAQVDALKFAAAAGATLAVAVAASWLLTAVGWDPRGSYVDTYVQRNSLVVGFVMGFAIIPIIYTVSEDALSSVPEHLRAASLGAGATPWQTAVRVIIPTAMSGVFSAVMIGFGRAVGETMIVLMAAGNTPILEWNIFNGFRTLSANIAVELPEAVQGGSIYRMLFLAALTLFVMTFAVNTVAEVIRQRFRRRAYEL